RVGETLCNHVDVPCEAPGDVGQEDQPFGAAGGRDLAGGDVGVDVVAGAVLAEAPRRDDRHVAALQEHVEQVRVNRFDLADETQVGLARQRLQLVRRQQ